MDVAKLTATGINGVKTITRNPDIKDIKTAYYAASSPYRGILEKPNLWDGSKDIVELSKGAGLSKKEAESPNRFGIGKPNIWDGSKEIEHITPSLRKLNNAPDNHIIMPDSFNQMTANFPRGSVVKMMPTLPDAKTEWGYSLSPEMEEAGRKICDALKKLFPII